MNNNHLSKVSIVCVTRNAAHDIAKCIDSILIQKHPNLELIIYDGASTDGTQQIIDSYGDKINFWKSEPDKGIYDAMNKALLKVTGEWVYFIGADDELLPEFSSFAANELKSAHLIYYANVLYKGLKTKGEISAYEEAKHGLFHQTIVYPSAVFEKYTYNQRYKVVADFALNIQLHGDKDFKFVYKDYTIAKYNDTGLSSYCKDDEFEKDYTKLIMQNFEWKVKARFRFKKMKAKLKGNR